MVIALAATRDCQRGGDGVAISLAMTFGSKAIIAHRQALRQSPVWRETEDLLRTVPGVGEQVFLTLLAYLSELGTLDHRRIAALVGVGPSNRDSGALRSNAPSVAAGPGAQRPVVGALVASRHNPVIRDFYAGAR